MWSTPSLWPENDSVLPHSTWDNKMKEKLEEISEVSFNHCICRACEKDFKRNVGSEGYKPRWRSENKENNGFSRCSVKINHALN